MQKHLSLLPEPDITSAARSVQAQFHHSLNKLSEAYVVDPSSSTLAHILLLPKLGLSKKLGPRSAPKAIRYLRAAQDLSVASLTVTYCLTPPTPFPREELVEKMVAKGNFGKAYRRLWTNDSVSLVTPEVIAELEK